MAAPAKVCAKFVGSDDVVDHILNIDATYGAKKLKEIVGKSNLSGNLSRRKKVLRSESVSADDQNKALNLNSSESESDEEKTIACRRASIKDLLDQCLKSQSSSKLPTSDHTLTKIKRADLNYESLHELLNKSDDHHVKEKKRLIEKQVNLFGKWKIFLSQEFNLLLFGVGSKFGVLNSFHHNELLNDNVIVIHGFFTGLLLKNILNTITDHLLDHETGFSSVQDQAEFIASKYDEDDRDNLTLVVHSLDAAAVHDSKFISILARLAKSRSIRIIASVDHVNSPLLWDNNHNCSFKWLWFEVNTFAPYRMETSYENSLLIQQGKTLALNSLHHVFQSLTPNAQGIFMMLAKTQLEHDKESSYLGISFPELFRQCREAFLVNSDLTLRTQLVEFKDHNMLRSRKAADGVEHLHVPIDSDTLQEFIDKQEG